MKSSKLQNFLSRLTVVVYSMYDDVFIQLTAVGLNG